VSWATVEDTTTMTGVTVTAAQLAQAQIVIDIFSGRTYAAEPRTGSRDKGWLKAAVAYQAAWITAQPDLFKRMDLTAVPGAAPVTGTGMVLAPMAKFALKRVSWLKSRSLHVRSPFLDGSGHVTNPLSEASDDAFAWSPMGGG